MPDRGSPNRFNKNMDEVKKAVKDESQNAATEKEENQSSSTNTEIDNGAALSVVEEELEKVRKERDNYRIGLLKAKGKATAEEVATEEDRLRQIIKEEFLTSKEAELQRQKEETLKKVIEENKELKLSLKNRAGISGTAASGGSQDKAESKPSVYLSEEQKSFLTNKKGIKWTPEMIKKLEEKMARK